MTPSEYWRTVFVNADIEAQISDASYPLYKAYNCDVVERHVSICNHIFWKKGE